MAKAIKKKAAKPKKPRATKYDEKLVINGTFEDLVKTLITPTPVQLPLKKK
jgi:hypothetical protein